MESTRKLFLSYRKSSVLSNSTRQAFLVIIERSFLSPCTLKMVFLSNGLITWKYLSLLTCIIGQDSWLSFERNLWTHVCLRLPTRSSKNLNKLGQPTLTLPVLWN